MVLLSAISGFYFAKNYFAHKKIEFWGIFSIEIANSKRISKNE